MNVCTRILRVENKELTLLLWVSPKSGSCLLILLRYVEINDLFLYQVLNRSSGVEIF